MAKDKEKKNLPFIIITALLGVSILIPVVLLVVSTLMNDKAADEFTKSLYPVKYESYVEKAASKYNVDACLVYGVIRTESNFNPDAVSHAGAIGLMQLMPDTFEWLQNYRTNFESDKLMNSDKLYDPKINIDYGVYFLSYLLDRYNGDKTLAICAYNAGYGNVDDWIANGTVPNGNVSPEDIPFTETSNYLSRVTEAMEMYRELYFSKLESYPDGTSSISDDISDNTENEDEENTSGEQEIYDTYGSQDENVDNNDELYYNDENEGYAQDPYVYDYEY